ncbi:MAG TPA: amidohydrolase family protein [Gemmatimonadaceae bacterium]
MTSTGLRAQVAGRRAETARFPLPSARFPLLAGLALAVASVTGDAQGTFVIRGGTVVPVTGPRITNGTVVIQNGRITAVGANAQAPAGATVIDATGQFVYPGLINAGTSLGLVEMGGVPGPVDTRELGDFNPSLITTSAVNVGSEHIGVTRANGITSVITVAGGSVLSGLAGFINLAGYTNEEMIGREKTALLLSWPNAGGGGGRGRGGGRFGGGGANPAAQQAAYQNNMRQIYRWFADAKAYGEVRDRVTAGGTPPVTWHVNYRLDAMVPAVRGEMPVLVDANTVAQMRDVVKFMDSLKVKVIIHGANEGWQYADTLAMKNIPVIVDGVTGTPGNDDPYDLVYANPGVLQQAGVTLAFATGGASSARDLPYEVGLSIAYGLDAEEALKAMTINPARMFGLDKDYGSIEVGKVANVIVTTGDPVDIRSLIREVFVKGQRMKFNDRHTELYEMYRARPKPPR